MTAATASYRRPPLSPSQSATMRPAIPHSPDSAHEVDDMGGYGPAGNSESSYAEGDSAADGRDALLDLAQLEELHKEAERMKALGNKHMAAQEFSKAYNAYSAALQLSPVGPSSHIFLSNRAAALLSLKRYSGAATDARRAIALAPTFGKAHARLGQALYFQKDFSGAIQAYQDALQFEPDNSVTITYLEKAKIKHEKQIRKEERRQAGEDVQSIAGESVTQLTLAQSVITTANSQQQAAAIVQDGGYRTNNPVMGHVAAAKHSTHHHVISDDENEGRSGADGEDHEDEDEDQDDPEFEEALRIQKRANRFLARKQYKEAIEEYTAALFLVPDEPNLSPELHLGRAHALNGSRRHESARNDAQLAIRLKPQSPAAYSTLAKSLFFMKDYRGAIEAFDTCRSLLPKGDRLGMFDQAYYEKAQAALEEEAASLDINGEKERSLKMTRYPFSTAVPKLPPPRFVPREKAIQQVPNMPRMPKQWPQQLGTNSVSFLVGEERKVYFFSESLGIKLNRGSDGIVRVIAVSPEKAASPIARKGTIRNGDVVREAAGVDIRRPITNVMWGDTVALIKMAPRPITLVVAPELSEVPVAVQEEQRKALSSSSRPSSS
ncbi:hypothetical protein ACA910_021150 [Epithemia clementina (nom. ined.)]